MQRGFTVLKVKLNILNASKENRNVPLPSISIFPGSVCVCACVSTWGREKIQMHRISFLLYVLQHRNYTSVKIWIILT